MTTTAFPIYDAHGNQVARLYRSGTGWTVADRTSLDAWGVVRSQQSGTDGRMAYCANLGHQTAEYGLTYMRARYYEPSSGRFVSEDLSHDGKTGSRTARTTRSTTSMKPDRLRRTDLRQERHLLDRLSHCF